MEVTIFESIYSKSPHYIKIEEALERIKTGRSKDRVEEIRFCLDEAKAKVLKESLPVVAFAGKLKARGDKHLTEHSGLIILDFDKLTDIGEMAATFYTYPHTVAYWTSPSGNGLKVLIKIADGAKHREHFAALRESFPDADPSGVNEERLCFESYDPHLFFNPDATPFTGVLTVKTITEKVDAAEADSEKFRRLLKWISGKGSVFAKGSRNTFIFKLAGACCRFGIPIHIAGNLIGMEYPGSNDFTQKEMLTAVKSAYKRNAQLAGTVRFEKDQLIEIKSRKEVNLSEMPDFDPDAKPRDVIYTADVKPNAMRLHSHGYENVKGIGVPDIDRHWKQKRGEVTCLTGIGNYGKSALYKWYILIRALLYAEKYATFSPEDNPPEEYYHDFVEMLLGCDCTPTNPNRPTAAQYEAAYDWIGKHIFYLYPQEFSPTPDYVKERFLELIIKEKIDGAGIDPWNQMTHDYGGGRSDIYLSTILGDFSRFAQANSIYFMIIAHPKLMAKDASKNYPCPDIFDLNDGAMWNNKLDNILAYHRPFRQTNPDDPTAEFHAKKIKRPKVVGKPGFTEMRYVRATRRFEFGNDDPIDRILREKNLPFVSSLKPDPGTGIPKWNPPPQPQTNFYNPGYNFSQNIPDEFWND